MLLEEQQVGPVFEHVAAVNSLGWTIDKALLAPSKRLGEARSDQSWCRSSRLDRVLPVILLNVSSIDADFGELCLLLKRLKREWTTNSQHIV